jgi:fructokinase
MNIVAYGETLWDLFPSGAELGGAPTNFAYRCHTLGHRTRLVSRLGRDELGEKAIRRIRSLGLDTSLLQLDTKHPTGTVLITFDAKKNPDYVIVPNVAYDYMEPNDTLLAEAKNAHCLCFGVLAQRGERSQLTLSTLLDIAENTKKFLDINIRKNCYSRDTILSSLQQADIVKLNQEELLFLKGYLDLKGYSIPELSEEIIQQWNLEHCVVTLGEKGAFAETATGNRIYIPGYLINLVNPCGSGDAFSAGYLDGILTGKPLSEAIQIGNAMGAIVATHTGAAEPLSSDEVTFFMKKNKPTFVDESLVTYSA